MVYKEDLCSIFKDLNPHKRLELMCGLVQCCMPLELRFIGTYVENLGKKDFHYLREVELKANSCSEITKLYEATEDVIRHKLAIYLSLLYTSNSACSKLVFDLLNSYVHSYLKSYLIRAYGLCGIKSRANMDVLYELLTILVMAINHPAFTFEQRSRLFEVYRMLETRAEHDVGIKSEPGQSEPVCCSPEPDDRLTPGLEDPAQPSTQPPPTDQLTHKVFIKSVEVKGSQRRDKKQQFRMEVTWSNGESAEVFKSYQELYEFHTKLVHSFPEEARGHKQERRLPFLPESEMTLSNRTAQRKRRNAHLSVKDDSAEQTSLTITNYFRKLVSLQQEILGCDHVIQFFRDTSRKSSLIEIADIPQPQSTIAPPPADASKDGDGPEQSSSTASRQYVRSITVYNSQLKHAATMLYGDSKWTAHSQAASAVPVISSRPSALASHVSPPCLSSPHHSPAHSPIVSRASSPGPQNDGLPTITQLLEQLQLVHHKEAFSKLTTNQLLNFEDEEFATLKLTKHAVKRLQNKLEQLGRMKKLPNGLKVGLSPSSATPPIFPSPAVIGQAVCEPPNQAAPAQCRSPGQIVPPPSELYPPPSLVLYTSNAHVGPLTGSEAGTSSTDPSPPASPLSQKLNTDSSGPEDSDSHREKLPGRKGVNNVESGKTSRVISQSGTEGIQSEEDPPHSVPPPTLHHFEPKLSDMPPVHLIFPSGYDSDPAHVMVTPYLPRPGFPMFRPMYPCKPPLPAHLPLGMYPKVIPPENFQGKMVPPMMQPQYVPQNYRNDGPAISNTMMTVTVSSNSYSNTGGEGPANQRSPVIPVMSPATNINRTSGPLHNSGNTRPVMAASSSSLHQQQQPPGVQAPQSLPPGHIGQNKSVNGQSSNGDSGISSPAPSNDGGYGSGPGVSQQNTFLTYSSSTQSPAMGPPSACNSCGCNGRCGTGPNYPAAYGGYVQPASTPPMFAYPPVIPPNSNGIIQNHQNIPMPVHNPVFNYANNGVSPEIYHNYLVHAAVSHGQGHNNWNSMLYGYSAHANHAGPREGKHKPLTCYNCGGAGHRALECKDSNMEAVSGHYSLNYKPKSDSD